MADKRASPPGVGGSVTAADAVDGNSTANWLRKHQRVAEKVGGIQYAWPSFSSDGGWRKSADATANSVAALLEKVHPTSHGSKQSRTPTVDLAAHKETMEQTLGMLKGSYAVSQKAAEQLNAIHRDRLHTELTSFRAKMRGQMMWKIAANQAGNQKISLHSLFLNISQPKQSAQVSVLAGRDQRPAIDIQRGNRRAAEQDK